MPTIWYYSTTSDPKLIYNKHIEITTTKVRKTIHILKSLTSTTWGKQKETIVATYKAITRPIHQQTTDNTKHRTQNSNWGHNRHTTSTRRNTHTTHKGTPPNTRITDKI